MSTGHHCYGGDIDTAPLSTAALDRLLSNPEIVGRLFGHTYDHTYDLPFLAGYSKDGQTIYFDRHLPEQLSYSLDGRTYDFNTIALVARHEAMEKACIDALGWGYYHSHAAANGYERRGVLAAGLLWNQYNNALKPYIKADEKENLKRVPEDLDMTPYMVPPIDKALIARIEAAQGKSEGKADKASVNYSEGMKSSHCGPTGKWKGDGDCAYFQVPHSCLKVKGYIDPDYWCKLWSAK